MQQQLESVQRRMFVALGAALTFLLFMYSGADQVGREAAVLLLKGPLRLQNFMGGLWSQGQDTAVSLIVDAALPE